MKISSFMKDENHQLLNLLAYSMSQFEERVAEEHLA